MAVNITLSEPQAASPVLERGPLKDLYRAPYTGIDNLQYPRDLGSTQKNHYVIFKIFDTKTVSDVITEKGFTNTMGNFVTGAASEIGNNLSQGSVVKSVFDLTNNAQPNTNPSAQSGVAFQTGTTATSVNASSTNYVINSAGTGLNIGSRTQTDSSGSISLYMPDGLEFQTQAQYGELSVSQAIASILPTGSKNDKGKTSTFDKSAFLGAAGRVLLNYAGYVFNPQQQLLFEGINFRSFSMSFTFTPYSSKEAETVKNIITKFRSAAAPQIVTGSLGFLFIPPSQFEISFKSGDKINPYINKLKGCYLQNVDVNYAPNGWSAHSGDGAPVQTTISLSFLETELIDRTQIAAGF